MRNPLKVADAIFEMMVNPGFSDGRIYNIRKRPEPPPEHDQALIGSFWTRCNEITEQYLKL
jgi:hypothetical protein